eukprot:Opistho-2@37704
MTSRNAKVAVDADTLKSVPASMSRTRPADNAVAAIKPRAESATTIVSSDTTDALIDTDARPSASSAPNAKAKPAEAMSTAEPSNTDSDCMDNGWSTALSETDAPPSTRTPPKEKRPSTAEAPPENEIAFTPTAVLSRSAVKLPDTASDPRVTFSSPDSTIRELSRSVDELLPSVTKVEPNRSTADGTPMLSSVPFVRRLNVAWAKILREDALERVRLPAFQSSAPFVTTSDAASTTTRTGHEEDSTSTAMRPRERTDDSSLHEPRRISPSERTSRPERDRNRVLNTGSSRHCESEPFVASAPTPTTIRPRGPTITGPSNVMFDADKSVCTPVCCEPRKRVAACAGWDTTTV